MGALRPSLPGATARRTHHPPVRHPHVPRGTATRRCSRSRSLAAVPRHGHTRYDARNNLVTVSGDYLYAASDWNPYTITNVYDHKNRRIFKSFLDSEISEEAQWYFTYDQLDRLVEVKHIPDTDVTTTYSIYDFYWIEDRPVAYYQLDFASGQGTVTTRRFLHADEIERPQEAWSWPTSGDASRIWAVSPDLFGWDYITRMVSITE